MKPDECIVRSPRGAPEFRQLSDIVYQSFAGFGRDARWTPAWLRALGPTNCRVALRDGRIVAGLGILFFGQYFGGREVPSAGISAVGVAAGARGGGVATAMMRRLIRELHRRGVAVSSLYPSTYALYRKAGYEPAGARIHYCLGTGSLGIRDHSRPLIALGLRDLPAIQRCYDAHAINVNGRVARTRREWRRLLSYGPDRVYAYGVPGERRGAIDGYVVYTQTGAQRGPMEVYVRDIAARDIRAIRRLLTFFADHATMAEHVYLEGGPAMPLLTMAREECVTVRWRTLWMLRVINVPKALEQRGYAPAVRTELHLDVHDDLLPDNNGRFVLTVRDGRGTVRPGGQGRLRTDIRGLAPLFTGHLSAHELTATGLLDGPDGALADATAVFAGAAPWMNDRF